MFNKKEITSTESVEEFLARGGKINKLKPTESARKRMEKFKRTHARMIKSGETEHLDKVEAQIEKYQRALTRR